MLFSVPDYNILKMSRFWDSITCTENHAPAKQTRFVEFVNCFSNVEFAPFGTYYLS